MSTRVLYPGHASGEVLRLTEPLSFWGGVDPETGRIIGVRHPQHGLSVADRVLVMPAAIGSSSSSSVMLELIRRRCAPAAILTTRADAILVVGCIVARELGYAPPPVFEVPALFDTPCPAGRVHVSATGVLTSAGSPALAPPGQ